MSKTFEQGREEISRLCRYFATNRQAFFATGVKEAHVRQNLIDPFFEALGWDVRNAAMTAPQYREVIPEDSLEIEGQQKAPDYTFRVGTLPKFYTEAKKCGINISADPGPAYQLRRYGWSAKVALSILTDFEELGVYDCSIRPRPVDKAGFGRIQYFRNEEYPDRWRELWDLFSREAVWSGAFDKFAASKRKRGTSEVDTEFLKEIEDWRDSLARNIALRNQFLSPDDLNASVQRTIDRVIFLRMAEDRGSESYGQLLKLCEQPNIYSRFMSKSCRNADEKYDSGLFHFRKEEGIAESPDSLTPKLQIDDKVFKPILQSLYFEHGSPYHFGVLPVEILGTVYERFLGKVIRLTHEHRAKVEEKPEVRKAGGVYYTPAYIVDYIVKNTVGRMIEGKSPAQISGGKSGQPFRVLDMACGSGSFLLGAYQCLLDHYLKWYLGNHPEKHREAVYFDSRRKFWRLTIAEKKRILTTHIFGVDIDPQAVEVSKLSLLLKVLEGETDESIGQSRMLFHKRALPNLSANIKCGNSLIGPDYFSGRLIPDPDEMKRVNPFDWNREFPEAMKSGGFDCVIGNPPYGADVSKRTKEYFDKKYISSQGNYESFSFFIEKSIKILNIKCLLGLIIPDTWFTVKSGINLRKYLLENTSIIEMQILNENVFAKARVDVCTIILSKDKNPSDIIITIFDKNAKEQDFILNKYKTKTRMPQFSWRDNSEYSFSVYINPKVKSILSKIMCNSQKVEINYIVGAGCKPYEVGKGTPPQSQSMVDDKIYTSNRRKDKTYKYLIRGADLERYNLRENRDEWLSYGEWLAAPRNPQLFEGKRLLFQSIRNPKLTRRIVGTLIDGDYINNNSITNIISKNNKYSLEYLLGILNSELINWYFSVSFNIVNIDPRYLKMTPIPIIDDFSSSQKSQYVCIVTKVKQMLELQKHFSTAKTEAEKLMFQRQIEATDREIDRMVYELYGLTQVEIDIIEGSK